MYFIILLLMFISNIIFNYILYSTKKNFSLKNNILILNFGK